MKQTRLKMVVFFGCIIALLCAYAIHKTMDGVSVVLAGALGAIIAKYTNDETKRPSLKKETE